MGTHPIFESDFDCLTGFRNEIFIEMNKVTWRQYEVDENETLMSISIKFDTSTEAIKRKNRISDQSEIWMGRVILVPERKVIEEVRKSPSPDFDIKIRNPSVLSSS